MLREIGLADLIFERVQVVCHTPRGAPYIKWMRIGMPRIPDDILDVTFYLYKSREDAEANRNTGGTGFFVSFPSSKYPDELYAYGVTNWHVACRDGFSVIRLNTKDGVSDIFEFGPEDWEYDPEGDDIAVVPVFFSGKHRYRFCPPEIIITKEHLSQLDIGVGDDVFMLGRFIDHDTGQTNIPAARFGNISLMPTLIEQPNKNKRETFCLDMHSRSGYSGSPVYVYRTPGSNLSAHFKTGKPNTESHLYLLGVHWGQFKEPWEIKERRSAKKTSETALESDGKYVDGLSGMTCVSPAWNIIDLLNSPRLRAQRAQLDEQVSDDFSTPAAESAGSESNDDHREAFNNLLDAAVRGKP